MVLRMNVRCFGAILQRRNLSKANFQIMTDIEGRLKNRVTAKVPNVEGWGPIGALSFDNSQHLFINLRKFQKNVIS